MRLKQFCIEEGQLRGVTPGAIVKAIGKGYYDAKISLKKNTTAHGCNL